MAYGQKRCMLLLVSSLAAATVTGEAQAAGATLYADCTFHLATGTADTYGSPTYSERAPSSCGAREDHLNTATTNPGDISASLYSQEFYDHYHYTNIPDLKEGTLTVSTPWGAAQGDASFVLKWEDTNANCLYNRPEATGVVVFSGMRGSEHIVGAGQVDATYYRDRDCYNNGSGSIVISHFELAGADGSAPQACPPGQLGLVPACVTPPQPCANGQLGAGSICVAPPPPPEQCSTGQVGVKPNCATPPPPPNLCPPGQVGVSPTCMTPPAPPGLGSGPPDAYSEKCSAPTANVADGFAGTTYTKLRVQQVDSDEAWVCFRISNGSTVNYGGRVKVSGPGIGAATPTIDSSVGSCSNVLFSGQVGDPANPPYVPVRAATASDSGSASVCVTGGDIARRVRIALPTATAPSINFDQDSPAVPDPAREDGPVGFPSSRCDEASGGRQTEVANMDLADSHLWLGFWQASSSKVDICARAEGPITAGGRLSVDATNSPGVSVTPQVSDDTTPCMATVVQVDQPVAFRLARSPNGAATPSLCVEQGATKKRVTVQVSGSPDPPDATWTADPDSPVGAVP